MEITIPFLYKMSVRTAAGDRVSRTYVENYSFVVPEVMGKDCPPVATVSNLHDGFNLGEASRNVVIRKLGDRFMEPLKREVWGVFDDNWDRERTWEPITPEVDGVQAIVKGIFERHVSCVRNPEDVKLKGPPRPETIEYDWERESHLARVRSVADNLRLIDGVLHAMIPEPVYRLTQSGVQLHVAEIQQAHEIFRLDEISEMLEAARTAVDAWGAPTFKELPKLPEVDLHDASLLQWKEALWGVRAAAKELFTVVGFRFLEMPIEVMEAYVDMRPTLSHSAPYDEAYIESDILPMAVGLRDAIAAHSYRHLPLADRFDAALRLLEKRTGIVAASDVNDEDFDALAAPGLR